ncbi:MAG: ArsR/SmtB family transcription factor [Acidimicrobiales bacterium]
MGARSPLNRREARAGAVFEALADPTRRTVLSMVGDEGPITATELAARLPVSRQAVAKHLETLRTAGLVEGQRTGREQHWTVVPAPLADASAWIEATGRRWDERLAALRRRVAMRRR